MISERKQNKIQTLLRGNRRKLVRNSQKVVTSAFTTTGEKKMRGEQRLRCGRRMGRRLARGSEEKWGRNFDECHDRRGKERAGEDCDQHALSPRQQSKRVTEVLTGEGLSYHLGSGEQSRRWDEQTNKHRPMVHIIAFISGPNDNDP